MATGEGKLFVEIWEDLEPEERVSFITGMSLPNPHEMRAYYFAHVVGKGRCPALRLLKKNIVLLTWDEHKLWDTKRWIIKENPHLLQMWDKMFKLEEEILKLCYGEKIHI